MTTRHCHWPNCVQPAREYCPRHYGKLWRLGRIKAGLIDPTPVRDRIMEHLRRGRTVHDLADRAGVDFRTVRRLQQGETAQVRIGIAEKIMKVVLPPTDVGTIRRIHALARLGYTHRHIAAHAGIPFGTFDAAVRRGWFTPHVKIPIADVFERLSCTPGPSKVTKRRAERQEYPSSMAWEGIDIDDPNAVPNLGDVMDSESWDEAEVLRFMAGEVKGRPATKVRGRRKLGGSTKRGGLTTRQYAARDEAIRRFTAAGYSALWISEQVSCTERTVIRVRGRLAAQELNGKTDESTEEQAAS